MKRTNTGRREDDGTKASNPKQAFGDAKMPLDLMPDTAAVQINLAFLEGALKYGQYNWRIAGVKASTYVRAMRRHLSKWWNGQNADPATMVNELASVGACVCIILDALAVGKLTDDRPPRADMEKALADAAVVAAHLKQLFKDHNPPQYTELEHGAGSLMEALAEGSEPRVSTRRCNGPKCEARYPGFVHSPECLGEHARVATPLIDTEALHRSITTVVPGGTIPPMTKRQLSKFRKAVKSHRAPRGPCGKNDNCVDLGGHKGPCRGVGRRLLKTSTVRG